MTEIDAKIDALVPAWLTLPDVAEMLDVEVTRVRQLVKEGQLIAVRRGENRALQVPADFIGGGKIVKGLAGTLTLLKDDGFSDEEMLEWLFTPDPTLPGTPAQALQRESRHGGEAPRPGARRLTSHPQRRRHQRGVADHRRPAAPARRRTPPTRRGEPSMPTARAAARRRPALPVHRRPQAQGDLPEFLDAVLAARRRHRAAARQGHGGRRGAGAPRRLRRRLPPARQAARGQRPRRRRPRHRLRRAPPRPGRPARPRRPRRSSATRCSSAAPATPRPRSTRPPPSPAWTTSAPGPAGPPPPSPAGTRPGLGLVRYAASLAHRTAPGSPSAASTRPTWTRCWTRAPAASSSSGRSPRPTTRRRRPPRSPKRVRARATR